MFSQITALTQNVTVSHEMVNNLVMAAASTTLVSDTFVNDVVADVLAYLPAETTHHEIVMCIANVCISKISHDLQYGAIASNVLIDYHHLVTPATFSECVQLCYDHDLVSQTHYHAVMTHREALDALVDLERNYTLDYFGIKTLERSYLIKIKDYAIPTDSSQNTLELLAENPQYLFLRVAVAIHTTVHPLSGDISLNMAEVANTYDGMSQKLFIHATPTLFNAGTMVSQLSSCFLLGIDDDLKSIFDQIHQIAMISKWAGGIGVHISKIRAKGTLIKSTNSESMGIIPLCVLLGKESRYVNQGGKRKGAICVTIEPWHAEVMEFCELRKTTSGNDENRARDLFLALWIPDLFMKRVEEDGMWSLMCPKKCPGLTEVYGEEFETLYCQYEAEQRYNKQIEARVLMNHIIECQIETGVPYMLYKDAANRKSNQKHLGTISSSNLCAEIIQYSDEQITATCNLASICLPQHVKAPEAGFNRLAEIIASANVTNDDTNQQERMKTIIASLDLPKLHHTTKTLVRNLNKVIDNNYYVNDGIKDVNLKYRPIGIGVQGLSDVFNKLLLPFGSVEAKLVNKVIFENIYFAALEESMELAKQYGKYEGFADSPMAQGILQFHMWDQDLTIPKRDYESSVGYRDYESSVGCEKWQALIEQIKIHGVRNSLLTALMPTAGTSQIMGCCEGFEPRTTNYYLRSTLAGDFIVFNEQMIKDFKTMGIWNRRMRLKIIQNEGSVADIPEVPSILKAVYRTAYEIKLKDIITQSAERGPFIDQSQSLNLFAAVPNRTVLVSAHMYGWKMGLKTGMYYLRSLPAKTLSHLLQDDEAEVEVDNNAPSCSAECEVCSA